MGAEAVINRGSTLIFHSILNADRRDRILSRSLCPNLLIKGTWDGPDTNPLAAGGGSSLLAGLHLTFLDSDAFHLLIKIL